MTGKGGNDESGQQIDREYTTTDINGGDFNLEIKVEIVDFEPKLGSLFGGTLLHLYGWNFVDRDDENVVRVGSVIGSQESQICIVEWYERGNTVLETNIFPIPDREYNSQIKCRIPTDYSRQPHSAEVVVFASTFEEARSNNMWNGGYHNFTFVDSATLPTIDTIQA